MHGAQDLERLLGVGHRRPDDRLLIGSPLAGRIAPTEIIFRLPT